MEKTYTEKEDLRKYVAEMAGVLGTLQQDAAAGFERHRAEFGTQREAVIELNKEAW